MRLETVLLTACLALGLSAQEAFLVKPYLQLGDAPVPAARERLDLLWHTADRDEVWTVEVRLGKRWVPQAPVTQRRLAAPPLPPHRICRATLRELPPGALVPYRVKRDGAVEGRGAPNGGVRRCRGRLCQPGCRRQGLHR